jgi:hypothetical protein
VDPFKTNDETKIAMPEKAIAAIISTISEEAPIRKYLYEYSYYNVYEN